MEWKVGFAILTAVVVAGQGCVQGRVDSHAHFIPPFYADKIAETNVSQQRPPWSVSLHLDFMESLGIQTSVLSITEPGARFSKDDVAEGRALARKLNLYARDVVRQQPQRFRFLATLTLPDVQGSVEEAIFALDELDASGVKVDANSYGLYFGDPQINPLMEVLNDRNATVFIHPSRASHGSAVDVLGLPAFIMDFEVEIARVAVNLLVTHTFKRFPNVKYHFAHAAGFIPFQATRLIGSLVSIPSLELTMEESNAAFKGLFYDIATVFSPPSLDCLLSFLPSTQILYGTDWPYTAPHCVYSSRAYDKYCAASLTSIQTLQINTLNAEYFYKLNPARTLQQCHLPL